MAVVWGVTTSKSRIITEVNVDGVDRTGLSMIVGEDAVLDRWLKMIPQFSLVVEDLAPSSRAAAMRHGGSIFFQILNFRMPQRSQLIWVAKWAF
jgi:hypothetical protein